VISPGRRRTTSRSTDVTRHIIRAGELAAMVSLTDYWDELEPTVLIVVGFVLFVIPEPATSTLGIGLMLLGIAWWFYQWGRP
jgi:hypothetical protein